VLFPWIDSVYAAIPMICTTLTRICQLLSLAG